MTRKIAAETVANWLRMKSKGILDGCEDMGKSGGTGYTEHEMPSRPGGMSWGNVLGGICRSIRRISGKS